MRVISGSRKGHPLKAVPGMNTRPTTDKVKEAIFSMIGPYFDGGLALDLFAGTGGLAIEALSRGMDHAFICDKDGTSIRIIKENLEKTRLTNYADVIRGHAPALLNRFGSEGKRFDLVFLDPPYQQLYYEPCLNQLLDGELLNEGAYVVVESDPSLQDIEPFLTAWKRLKRAHYGNTCIDILKRSDPFDGGESIDGNSGISGKF